MNDIKRVLLIKLRYIGDTIMLLPVIDNIRLQLPQAHIAVMVSKGTEEILSYAKNIDELICYDRQALKFGRPLWNKIINNTRFIRFIRKNKYDLVIDFTGSDRSAILALLSGARVRVGGLQGAFLERIYFNHLIRADINTMHIVDYELKAIEQIGFKILTDEFLITVPEDIQAKADGFFFPQGIDCHRIRVVIHPGARRLVRRWPPERFAEIASRLIDNYDAEIFLVAGPGEEDILSEVRQSIAGKIAFQGTELSLIQLAALLKRCSLYLGNDTGSSHVAAGAGIRMITLFGPQYPQLWAPYTKKGLVLSKNLPCMGCNHINCTEKENLCMTGITVDEVWDKVVIHLSKLQRFLSGD